MIKSKGFTLIELLVVMAIIITLMSVVLYSVSRVRKQSRDTQRFADLKMMQDAVELYKIDNGTYPDTSGSWQGAISYGSYGYGSTGFIPGLVPIYLDQLPADPSDGEVESSGHVRDWLYRSDGYDYKILGHFSSETITDCSDPLVRGPSICEKSDDGFSIARYSDGAESW